MHCGIPKGTSQAEVTSNSEKIKPVALTVIELCLSEGISQLLSLLVEIPLHIFKKILEQLLKGISGQSESLFGLSFT